MQRKQLLVAASSKTTVTVLPSQDWTGRSVTFRETRGPSRGPPVCGSPGRQLFECVTTAVGWRGSEVLEGLAESMSV